MHDDGRTDKDVAEIADRVWYPIWDAQVPLDHSVRTIAEARRRSPIRTCSAALGLLDARYVAGRPRSGRRAARTQMRQRWRANGAKRLPELRAAGERAGAADTERSPSCSSLI